MKNKTQKKYYSDCQHCFSSDTHCIKQTWDKIFICNVCDKESVLSKDDDILISKIKPIK